LNAEFGMGNDLKRSWEAVRLGSWEEEKLKAQRKGLGQGAQSMGQREGEAWKLKAESSRPKGRTT